VDASLSRQGISGLLKGSYGSGVILDLLPPDTQTTQGELVVTAGINPVIPKNILIGQVQEVISSPNDLFKKLTIQSPVNFHDLRYVFVVR
jgi:cell shape-determining protein MreC